MRWYSLKFRENKTFIILIFLLLLIGTISSVYAADRSYSIPGANIDLFVGDDGTLHVTEVIHYHFIGTFYGIYRNIPIQSNQNIENIRVNVSGAYYNYTTYDNNSEKIIKVFLYSDPGKTTPIHDTDIDVTYNYDMLHVVKFYNDIAELQYKLWGEEWYVPVGHVNAIVHLKSNNGVKYCINPPYLAQSLSWNKSNLLVTSTVIPENNWFEVRLTIPLEQFTSYNGGQKINQKGTVAIENIQNNYASWVNFEEILYSILPLLSFIYPFLIFYQSWGGPFRIKGKFTGNLPENDPPAIVNAICGNGISKDIGDPGIDGFLATIMDLIKRRYLLVDHKSDGKHHGLKLRINDKKDAKHIKNFEKIVLDFLKKFEKNQIIYLDEISENLEKNHFQKRFFDWRKFVIKKLSHGKLESMFLKKNNNGLYIYGFVTLLGSLIIMAMTLNNPIHGTIYSFYVGILLLIVSFISLLMTTKVNGRWTDHGKEYRANWIMYKNHVKNLKKYQKNYNDGFDNYLVYGTALGVGDQVTKYLRETYQIEELSKMPLYVFQNSNEYKYFRNTLISYMGVYGVMQVHLIGNNSGGGSFGFGGGGMGGAGGGSGGGGGGGGAF